MSFYSSFYRALLAIARAHSKLNDKLLKARTISVLFKVLRLLVGTGKKEYRLFFSETLPYIRLSPLDKKGHISQAEKYFIKLRKMGQRRSLLSKYKLR